MEIDVVCQDCNRFLDADININKQIEVEFCPDCKTIERDGGYEDGFKDGEASVEE